VSEVFNGEVMMILRPPRLRYLGHVTGLAVYVVDGEHIRNEIDVDFTCGGNEAVYPNYVPANEIWIDNALAPLDATATLLHEIVERNLMMRKDWGYDRAHDAASAAERPFRKELRLRRPTRIDLARVERALLEAPATKAAPRGFHREYPKVRAVGKRRKSVKIGREVDAILGRKPR
jgi:hypothetical protein